MNSDDHLNPGQRHIDDTTDFLKRAENNKNKGQSDQLDNSSDLKNAEENSNSSWKNNVSSKNIATNIGGGVFKSFIKKRGPAATIMLTLLFGGMGISTLLSPSLLLMQMREVFTDKFNNQLTSLEKRKVSFYTNKTTSGSCSGIKIACKFSTFSEKQIENFKKAGIDIEVDADASKTMTGRSRATSFSFEGNKISASEFNSKLKNDVKFRSAVKVAYNPKLSSFSDTVYNKIARLFKVSKTTKTITGDTDEARLKSLQEDMNSKNNNIKRVGVGDIDENGNVLTDSEEDLKKIDEMNSKIDDLVKEADSLADSGDKLASEILDGIDGGGDLNITKGVALGALDGVATSLKVTDTPDMACSIKQSFAALTFAAKTVRSAQLARFAMFFLTSADQIKAGKADPNTISFLGKILTSTKNGKSATDSFGFKYAAYGDTGKLPSSASQYMTGGGLTGVLSKINSIADDVINSFGGNKVCKFLGNPFVSAASLIVGVGLFLVPGINVVWTAKEIAEAGKTAVFTLAMIALPSMLKDIVAGNLIDSSTIGESAGNAITSGASSMMGSVAHAGGNAPLTPSQAVAYNNATKDVIAQYAEEDRLAYGQFDITNSNTFLGKLALNLTPFISNLSSLSGVFNSITSMPIKSFASITAPISYATSTDEYTMCEDPEYRSLGVATDPFCNVYYGIPVEDLDISPIDVVEKLYDLHRIESIKGVDREDFPQISEEGSPIDKYQSFVNKCINNTEPLTDSECMYGTSILIAKSYQVIDEVTKEVLESWPEVSISNKYFYISSMDQRIENMMDNI